ncbi:type II toxin-antitoxin system HicB family antitoxin [Treponema sp. TIM-1]|uniref:type II toxin-antitoxin system HicB family antitoxin n=1 Tax=Treponema sp. TIM-1 TaxID=2898417 RepID=UPI00397F9BFA
MEIDYTYWQEPDGCYLGYLNCWPEHWTQGKSISELEEMLLDLYDFYLEDEKEKAIEKKTGHLDRSIRSQVRAM